jgi:ubiquinone/menaquinone biosynthesis C-methylase UbiE
MYGEFARVYDTLMDDVDYDAWARHYLHLIAPCAPKRICECACGTGSLSVRFAREGLAVTGVDLSEEMLRVAQEKARAFGVKAAFIHQDMCRLALPGRVDAVLATCDGVNYLTRDGQAGAFFKSAYQALRPGGMLAFDVSSRAKLSGTLGDAFFGEDREEITYLWQNAWNEEKQCVRMDIAFFLREADGRYRRFDETHVQRAYGEDELTGLLEQAGFADIRALGGFTMQPPTGAEERMHVLAIKRRE